MPISRPASLCVDVDFDFVSKQTLKDSNLYSEYPDFSPRDVPSPGIKSNLKSILIASLLIFGLTHVLTRSGLGVFSPFSP
jgi:hypothetical protein